MDNRSSYASLALLFLVLQRSPPSSGNSDGVCVSKGGRFPPFSSEGKFPRKVNRGSKDLTLCRVFRKRTCCDVAQTYPASLAIRRLASTGEATKECLHLWELLECSICDPHVGVQPGLPLICTTFCDRVYDACSGAYFSMDERTRFLAPCGVKDFVCGKAAEWVSNGTELCSAAGFAVKPTDNLLSGAKETFCFGGKESFDEISSSWKNSQSKDKSDGILEDFNQWMLEMPYSSKVSWAIGGMVLTAGLLFLSKRKSYRHRQKLAAIRQMARRMEPNSVARPSEPQINRKVHQR